MACFWYMSADLSDDPKNWVQKFNYIDYEEYEKYIISFYWIAQTVVTVGYGDIYAGNTTERIISCILMFIGVFFYSFTIGSLSSLLSNLDSKNASIEQKLSTLIQLKNEYKINNLLYHQVKRTLKYGYVKTDEEKLKFLNELPLNLRIELSCIMHRKLVEKIEFFDDKKLGRFISYIGPYLKPKQFGKYEYIFIEGEYADEMYFIKTGNVSMVIKDHGNFKFRTIEARILFW